CKNQFAVVEISPEKYNQLYDTFTLEGKKLNTLLAWAHAKSLEEVLSRVQCSKAISDQFADERFILGKLQERGKKIELVQQHKAEIHTAVAAASILARARFLEKLTKLSEEVGFPLLKGASLEVVEQAKKIVESKGEDILKRIAKIHFKTTKSVIS
ncbi:MAG: ribonuclease HIII, partial [Stygiobacter sp.]